ncbi:MAG: sensor histidine kinase [Planctomycetia bacterium]|nr:sensor histidine kinase [Planctomycetia bacterium]
MTRLFGLAAAVTLVLMTAAAQAGLSINAVTVDGRAISLPAGTRAGSAGSEPLRIPSAAGRVLFEFGGAAEPISPESDAPEAEPPRPAGARLRYRLDGVDSAWRDGEAAGRISLGFADAEAGIIGSVQEELLGESAGWTGAVAGSPWVKGTTSGIVPPLTKQIFVNVLSYYVGAAVGVMGVDDVMLVVEHANGGRDQYDLNVELSDPASLDGLPRNWTKSGTKLAMSQIRMRGSPAPHAILTIVDDEPDRYGGWLHIAKDRVEPGDRVTLSWSAAWSLGVGGEATAEYRDLKPGTYFFRIGAFYPNGEPTGIETVLAVEVYVPWYLRRDMWAGAAAVGLAGVVTAGRAANVRRIKRQLAEMERERQLEQERARIARDLHDDVGAGLTEIAVQTDWLRRDVEHLHDAEITGRADRVCQSAVELIRSVDAIVWAVNPKNDTLDRFVGYLTHSADQFVRAAGLGIRLDVPDEVPATPLPGRVRHNLLLIVREAVNNAVKHAQAKLVWLGVRLDRPLAGGRVTITVEDDGRGFDPNEPADDGRHSGLDNMRRRADDIGGTLTLTSRPGSGTRVEITAPLA